MKKFVSSIAFLFSFFGLYSQSTNSCVISNAGFENGNLTGWTFKSGGYGVQTPCPSGSCPRYGTTWTGGIIGGGTNTALNSTSRHTLMTTAGGNDPNATAPAVPVVAPGGGNYSFRLGNSVASASTVTGMADAEAATLTFAVSNQNALFTYMYAFFVNNPGHTYAEQPSFEVVVLDQSGNIIPCGQYFVVAGNNTGCVNGTGFVNGNNGYVYKPWSSVSLDLTGYIGQNVSVEFRTTDCLPAGGGASSTICSNGTCTLTVNGASCTYPMGQPPCTPGSGGACAASGGTHSAYAYIDAYCAPLTVTQPVFCAGASSVQICAPTGYASYSWPSGQPGLTGSPTTQCVTINNPVAGNTYSVNMVSFTGCPTTTTVTLQGFNFTLNDTTICPGGAPFQIPLIPSVPGTYTYTWTPATGLSCTNCQSPVFTPGANSASYTVTMASTGPGACSATQDINITIQPSTNVTATGATVCSGQNATLVANGQACGGNVTYSWSPATYLSSTNSATVTAVNPTQSQTYTVTVNGPGGQTAQTTVQLNVNPLPTITAQNTVTCVGTAVNLTASGASTYTWTPGGSNGATFNVNPSSTTTYTVSGTDINGCANTNTVTVTVNPLPIITVNSPSICATQNASLSASGATSYTWSNGATGANINVSPSSTTVYTVTGTTNGCSSTATTTVTVGQNIGIAVNSPSVCAGQSATITASGATTYTWSTGSNANSITVTPGSTTVYTVSGTTGLCSGVNTSTVTIHPLPIITPTGSTICAGSSTTISANGAQSYTWTPSGLSGSSVNVSPAITTNYTVTGSDINGCVNADTVSVIVNPIPTVVATGGFICSGQTTSLTASGAQTYLWSNGMTGGTISVSPSSTTIYTVTGTSNNCSSSDTLQVTVGPNPVLTVNNPTICAGQQATITASGASTYQWSNGSNNSSINVNPGTNTSYTVIGFIASCSDTLVSLVTVNPIPIVSLVSDTVCAGQTATLTASGANTYLWLGGVTSGGGNTATISPAVAGSYSVIGSSLGCTDTASTQVFVNPIPILSINNATICEGQTASLSVNGANSYLWQPGGNTQSSISVSPQNTTTYTVTGTSNGCSTTITTTVTVNPIPQVTAVATEVCSGSTSTITASGASSYIFSPGANPVSPNSANASPTTTTTYTVQGMLNGCYNQTTVTVVVNPIPAADFSGPQSGCVPQVVAFTDSSQGALFYQWQFGDGSVSSQQSPVHVYSQPGVYSVTLTVTSANGCTNTQIQNAIINVYPYPDANIVSDNYSASEMEPTIYFSDYSSGSASCYFTFGDGDTLQGCGFSHLGHTYPGAGTYCGIMQTVTQYGCKDSANICVEITPEWTFYVPNAFTPDANGTNDYFNGKGTNIIEYEMMIFDRWGEMIFKTNSLDRGWDGRYKGNVAQIDVYVYKIKLKDIFNKKHEYHGTVSLIR
jgi:gliding motility-associated-like protein